MLSRWELTVDGSAPRPLTAQQSAPYSAIFLCRAPPPAGLGDSTLLVERARYVGEGMREDVTIRNTGSQPVACAVALAADADFADLFEVKDGRARPQAAASARGDSTLRFACRKGERQHELPIDGDGRLIVTGRPMRWQTAIPAHGQWAASIEVVPDVDGVAMKLHHPRGEAVEHAIPARNLREWRQRAPQMRTADHGLAATLERSLQGLGALRIFDPIIPDGPSWPRGRPGSWPCSAGTRC